MGKGKKIVCRCEDITEEEVKEAIHMGYTDMESLKRFLGFGTGPCQGRTCIPHVLRILARETGKSLDELGVTTARPPAVPTPMRFFAGEVDVIEDSHNESTDKHNNGKNKIMIK